MTPDALNRMRSLWEGSPEMSAAVIGERFGVSKNVVIGHANRRGWGQRPSGHKASHPVSAPKLQPRLPLRDRAPADYYVTRTLSDRVDALHFRLDDVLRETAAVSEAERAKMRTARLAAAERKAGAAA